LTQNFKGSISRRIEPRAQIDMGIDWRNVKYRRWEPDNSTIGWGNDDHMPMPYARRQYDNYSTEVVVNNGVYQDLYIIGQDNKVGYISGPKGDKINVYNVKVEKVDNLVFASRWDDGFFCRNIHITEATNCSIGGQSSDSSVIAIRSQDNDLWSSTISSLQGSQIGIIEGVVLGGISQSKIGRLDKCTGSTIESSDLQEAASSIWIVLGSSNINELRNAKLSSIFNSSIVQLKQTDMLGTNIQNCSFNSVINLMVVNNFNSLKDCKGASINTVTIDSSSSSTAQFERVDFGGNFRNTNIQAFSSIRDVKFMQVDDCEITGDLMACNFDGWLDSCSFDGVIRKCTFKGDFGPATGGGGARHFSSSNHSVLSGTECKDIYIAGSAVKIAYYSSVSPETLTFDSVTANAIL